LESLTYFVTVIQAEILVIAIANWRNIGWPGLEAQADARVALQPGLPFSPAPATLHHCEKVISLASSKPSFDF
jgi:hypothetical protein